MKILIGPLVGVLAGFITSSASAETLGDPGTISISGHVGVQDMRSTAPSESTFNRRLGANLFVDRFIAPNVSVGVGVGGSLFAASMKVNNLEGTSRGSGLNGSLRLGYFVPLGARAGFWPVARVGVSGDWSRAYDTNDKKLWPTQHGQTIEAALDVQLTYSISDHVYLRANTGGLNAMFRKTEGGSARQLSGGFNGIFFFGVGGWF